MSAARGWRPGGLPLDELERAWRLEGELDGYAGRPRSPQVSRLAPALATAYRAGYRDGIDAAARELKARR